jgi:predicted phosphodiesterase
MMAAVRKYGIWLMLAVALLAVACPVRAAGDAYLRGDVDLDGRVEASDMMALIEYYLNGQWMIDSVGDEPCDSAAIEPNAQACQRNADTDLDGVITMQDLADLIDFLLHDEWPVTPEEHQVLTLLHLSDSHGFAAGLEQALVELDGDSAIDAMLFTGDWTGHAIYNNTVKQRCYAVTTPEVDSAFNAIKRSHGDKLLMLTGNHDSYDNNPSLTCNGSQQRATDMIKGWMTEGVVTWGDTTGVASYWHKDYPLADGHRLRIVALDQYETTAVGKPSKKFTYRPIYSQAQVDWLVQRLRELSPDDYLIIALHEPAYQDDSAIAGLKPTLSEDSTHYLDEPERLFVSERLTTFNYRGDTSAVSINLLPRIMDAYLHGYNLTDSAGGTVYYQNLNAAQTLIPVVADFEGHTPCHFLFYLGGHRHCDICTPLPEPYSDQLMIHVTAADWTVTASTDDDLLSHAQESTKAYPVKNDVNVKACESDPDYRINKMTLDFGARLITIDRLGAQHTAGGRLRTTIVFPF